MTHIVLPQRFDIFVNTIKHYFCPYWSTQSEIFSICMEAVRPHHEYYWSDVSARVAGCVMNIARSSAWPRSGTQESRPSTRRQSASNRKHAYVTSNNPFVATNKYIYLFLKMLKLQTVVSLKIIKLLIFV